MTRLTAVERFWAKVDRRGPYECWPWLGSISAAGYGPFRTNGYHLAHRFAYGLLVGPIPEGYQVDHDCHNKAAAVGLCTGGSSCLHRRCCNPAHLEAVTGRTNTLRSLAPSALNAVKTHCPNGHPYDDVNTYRDRKGRRCRACARALDLTRRRPWTAQRREIQRAYRARLAMAASR